MAEASDQRGRSPIDRAEEWVDERTQPPEGRPKGLEDVEGTPSVDELRRQQHREMRTVGLGTEGQFKGAIFGTIVGGAIGALAGFAIGWFLLSDLDTTVRVILPTILGAAAGAVGQFVYWGSRTPELENETSTTSGTPQAGSSPRDARYDDRGR